MRRLLAVILFCAGLFCITQSEAFFQSRDSNYNISIVSGGGSTTTWNPSDKDPGITLSNGNLTATSSTTLANCSVSGYCSVRAIASHSTGKFYYEEVVTNLGSAGFDNCIGVADASQTLGIRWHLHDNGGVHGGANSADRRRRWCQIILAGRQRRKLERKCWE
jgi:hypothetical protein